MSLISATSGNVPASGGGGGLEGATTPSQQTVEAVTAGTEYSFVLPSGTKRFKILSDTDKKFVIYYTLGDDSDAWPVYPGAYYSEEALTLSSSLSVYIKSTSDNNTLKIVSWT